MQKPCLEVSSEEGIVGRMVKVLTYAIAAQDTTMALSPTRLHSKEAFPIVRLFGLGRWCWEAEKGGRMACHKTQEKPNFVTFAVAKFYRYSYSQHLEYLLDLYVVKMKKLSERGKRGGTNPNSLIT